MAKAVVDPAELRQFANDLRRFNQDLDNHMRILQTRMQTLAQSWRDQEQTKFTAEFEEALVAAQAAPDRVLATVLPRPGDVWRTL